LAHRDSFHPSAFRLSRGTFYLAGRGTFHLAATKFDIHVQAALDGDIVNDATIHWPADRPSIPFGTIALTAKTPDDEAHRRIIFDPIPRVDGIEPSDDPLLELRAAIYLLSGRRRRQAIASETGIPQKV
jgi:catalase